MKILIAEDSATARTMVQQVLQRLGHECLLARDGSEAWERFADEGADVIISDWVMPGIDGEELCRRVRELPGRGYTYFIMLSSLNDAGYVVRGMEAGADDYLKKPFNHDDLMAKLISAERVTKLHASLRGQRVELEQLNRRLFEESRQDTLTRLGNRIALREQFATLSASAERYGHTDAIALFDVDCFKAYNDTCGHLAGDDVLSAVAGALAAQCRQGDGAYRYGGEEFLVVLVDQGLQSAALAAERIRAAVEALAIPHPGRGAGEFVTVSAGVATLDDADGHDFKAVVKRADIALYRAKESGRNRVELGAAGCDVAEAAG
jgi:two-component system chemotaxis response regulator CheY